ncbi:2-dehydro-3-deoxygluconokinase/dehydrogluconokinase [Halopolyspora algeriensis]|uniref:2-dehydro-3-deoxygluconokinase/dehydrogluconokinase n=1 Tax=Halopolyspora algeriensis TaxID=1500506 RepID=A0A368VQR3_9ACTN|nr:sugar kinase [Halopolyspora algeriensis]RCW43202.1 2-dehydro-3-deoxygluconokinase/dehydrogluconokinase [Halopolyspora algeriensis]TQM56261.1 2-dehydro-3-deoxygluconokinase/dehydrogluconokinase [Halopolyspora algeriensis]
MPEYRDVVTSGEVMAMFVATTPGPLQDVEHFDSRLAGAEMNVSVGLARLGHSVRYLGAVGDDPFGARARHVLASEGIDVSGLRTDPSAPTGFQLKNRVHHGDPTVVYFRRGSAGSQHAWSSEIADAVTASGHLHVTGVLPALTPQTRDCTFRTIDAARRAGTTVTLDPNLRPSLWSTTAEMIEVINELATLADCVLPGLSEGRMLTGRNSPDGIAEFYLERGVEQVVTKLGEAGAVLHTHEGTRSEPAFPVRVVDTVGAGDGFAAGWISGLLDGLPEQDRLRRACVAGAAATTSEGDMDGLPTRTELDELLGRTVA